ncbi:MAG: M24 family metallopeptidase [Planctomycetota bacterium]
MGEQHPTIMAGVPARNMVFYHRIRFAVGDPAALIELPGDDGITSVLILRDIEMDRARAHARADQVACPADFAPQTGLSGDRETATAQAAAECLKRAGITLVDSDRTLPLIYAHVLREAGIEVHCDVDRGVASRRAKDEAEIEHLREAQRITEGAMEMACGLIAGAKADRAGLLHHESAPLTSERVRTAIDVWLLEHGYTSPGAIVASGSQGADCHNAGSGPLRTGEPVIVDIFPQDRQTLYNGDCTRTVVHGDVPDQVRDMRRAVAAAKAAAIAAIRAGVTGEQVHGVTTTVIEQHGYSIGLPAEDAPEDFCAMVHGTGHGVGLEVHEPPLLDMKGPELVGGDAVTVEPGVYSKATGGVRLEDLVIVTSEGCINLNQLPEELTWK